MKNKKLVLTIAALAMILAIVFLSGLSRSNQPEALQGEKSVTVVIIHKDGTEKKWEYDTEAEFLSELLLEQKLITGYASEEYGFTIESADGETANWTEDNAYWALYEGEVYATTSAAGMALKDGGIYRLVYENF